MAVLNCCCGCDFDLESLPVVTKEGWTAGSWVFNEETCCAEMILNINPESCTATFIDGGYVDFNSNTTTSVCNHMVQLYEATTAAATIVDGVIYPPAVDCPPCLTPFVCAQRIFEQTVEIATRVGLLYAPYQIKVSICLYDVSCPYLDPVKKYVLESTYYFKVKSYFKKYMRTITSDVTTASGCCTGSADNSHAEPEPDFSSESFWGIDFDCAEVADGSTVQAIRYKTYASMPSGSITFEATDCSPCPGSEECLTQICAIFEGVSDPYFGGTWLICAEMEVRSVTCEIPAYENVCNGLYWFIDPAHPELGIQCGPRPPIPRPTPATCGPYTFVDRAIFSVTDPAVMACSYFGDCMVGGNYSPCLSEGECPDPSTRLSLSWLDTLSMTFDNTCSGGTDQEVCIDIPNWGIVLT